MQEKRYKCYELRRVPRVSSSGCHGQALLACASLRPDRRAGGFAPRSLLAGCGDPAEHVVGGLAGVFARASRRRMACACPPRGSPAGSGRSGAGRRFAGETPMLRCPRSRPPSRRPTGPGAMGGLSARDQAHCTRRHTGTQATSGPPRGLVGPPSLAEHPSRPLDAFGCSIQSFGARNVDQGTVHGPFGGRACSKGIGPRRWSPCRRRSGVEDDPALLAGRRRARRPSCRPGCRGRSWRVRRSVVRALADP